MMRLYYYPGNASLTPHMLLEEIGSPFELALVDRANAAHKAPEYLKLNPNGLIPVLIDGDSCCTKRPRSASISRTRIPKPASHRRSEPRSARISTSGWSGRRTRCRRC